MLSMVDNSDSGEEPDGITTNVLDDHIRSARNSVVAVSMADPLSSPVRSATVLT